MCLLCAGAAHALSVDIIIPDTDPWIVSVDKPIDLRAVAYDDQQEDISDEVTWCWEFGDNTATDDDNPTQHVYEDPGDYTVTVTATLSPQQAQDQIGIDAQVPTGAFVLARQLPSGAYVTVEGDDICHRRYIIAFDTFGRGYDGVWFLWKYSWETQPEFHAAGFVYPSQQITLDGQQRNEAWVMEWPTDENPGQPEAGWFNAAVDWRITGQYLDWEMEPADELIGEPTWTIDNTVISSTDGVLRFDPEDEELDECPISWTITHLDAYDVEFRVPITIYDLAGNVVYTHTEEHVALGTPNPLWTWDGTIDGEGTAEKGIYTYTLGVVGSPGYCGGVKCVCDGEASCARGDWDKSAFLEISDVDLSDVEFESRELRFTGTVGYTLSEAAETAELRVYDRALAEVKAMCIDPTAGPHDVAIDFTVAPDPMGEFYFVISALETEDRALSCNRDPVQKPALQRGATIQVLPLSLNMTGVCNMSVRDTVATRNSVAQEQRHQVEGDLYPLPRYDAATVGHDLGGDPQDPNGAYSSPYWRLSALDSEGEPNPNADAAFFYIGHGVPGALWTDQRVWTWDGDEPHTTKDILDSGSGTNDPDNDVYYMGNMPAGSLNRCLVVMLVACWSAVDPDGEEVGDPSILQAFLDKGAGCGIGTLGEVSSPWANEFAEEFWEHACRNEGGDVTILDAFDYARDNSGTPEGSKWLWHYEANGGDSPFVRPGRYQ